LRFPPNSFASTSFRTSAACQGRIYYRGVRENPEQKRSVERLGVDLRLRAKQHGSQLPENSLGQRFRVLLGIFVARVFTQFDGRISRSIASSTTCRIIVPSTTHRSTLRSLRLWQRCQIPSICAKTEGLVVATVGLKNIGNEERWEIMNETAQIGGRQPIPVKVEEGKTYWWCACGLSKAQPFCDGSHKATNFVPVEFKPTASKEVWFCACKRSSRKPMCDGSHQRL
jgi:CDGSH iron-sulfur domain-containing protein 3